MSHFTRVKTRINNENALREALTQLNYRISPVNIINGWQGATRKADLVVKSKGHNGEGPYDIGFTKNAEGTYDVISDWWGLRTTTGIEQEKFVNSLTSQYQLVLATQQTSVETQNNYVLVGV